MTATQLKQVKEISTLLEYLLFVADEEIAYSDVTVFDFHEESVNTLHGIYGNIMDQIKANEAIELEYTDTCLEYGLQCVDEEVQRILANVLAETGCTDSVTFTDDMEVAIVELCERYRIREAFMAEEELILTTYEVTSK